MTNNFFCSVTRSPVARRSVARQVARFGILRVTTVIAGSLLALVNLGSAFAAEPKIVLPLWPEGSAQVAPLPQPEGLAAPLTAGRQVPRLQNVANPTLAVYEPPVDIKNGTAVIVCPGGGYSILAIEHEGTAVCEWLNTLGVTAILLKYRVPARKDQPNWKAPLEDGQRAIELVRANAKEWGLNPERIGILGFSAGHLAALASTRFETPEFADAKATTEKANIRPDFTILVYPAYMTKGKELSELLPVTSKTPTAFMAHAFNDPVTCESSLFYATALKKANVPFDLHIYSKGGHGFGMFPDAGAAATWPARCEDWLRASGLIPEKPLAPNPKK